jgi:cysteine desulfurase/selenocysteine lyase
MTKPPGAPTRIYLDNAATSFPKPPGVVEAMSHYMAEEGVSLGRAATRAGDDLARRISQLRARLAAFFGAAGEDEVVFTFSGTDSLNTVLHGALRPGDHVVTTDIEHNSILRPLEWLRRREIGVTHVRCDDEGRVAPEDLRLAMRPETRLVAVSHASNVTGTIQPIADFASIAHAAGSRILVDACQTAGHLPIDLRRDDIDFLACSGHKGMRGPLGTGLLVIAAEAANSLESFRQGGTGTLSESPLQPAAGPEKFEAGNHNTPGLIGLAAALAWIEESGLARLRQREIEQTGLLMDRLRAISNVRVPGPSPEGRVGVVSLVVEGLDPREVATILDGEFAIEVRAGLHCAPRIHEALGTRDGGGTVRISPGSSTDNQQIVAATDALAAIAMG